MDLVLKRLELASPVSESERAALHHAFGTRRTFRRGQVLLEEGKPPPFIAILLEGLACGEKFMAAGRRQIIALRLPGDVFDLQSALADRMDHTVLAITQCRVATASYSALEDLSQRFPRLGALLWRDAATDTSILRAWIANIGGQTAYGRVAHLFCELFVRLSRVGLTTQMSYRLPLTQAALSEATGLSVVHMNRVLQQLRAHKLIALTRQHITILDWDRLAAAGGFDPAYLQAAKDARPDRSAPPPLGEASNQDGAQSDGEPAPMYG